NHDALDDLIRKWTNKFDKYELMHMLQGKGIPAGPVLTGQEVHFDEHYQSRNFLERVTYPDDRNMGTRLLMGRPYKYSNTPLKIRKPAPPFGAENEYLLKDLLGLSVDDYDQLIEQATISSVPLSGDPAPRIDPRQSVEEGLLGHWDPDYRDHLGIS
ncbi:MAG: CoA transferase, partial [Chloroflexota bacterium]|nr:CoA transferase [Chloroflexota bacterium]